MQPTPSISPPLSDMNEARAICTTPAWNASANNNNSSSSTISANSDTRSVKVLETVKMCRTKSCSGILASKKVYCDACFDRKHVQSANRADRADEKRREREAAKEKEEEHERAKKMDYDSFLDNFRNDTTPNDDIDSEFECEADDSSSDSKSDESESDESESDSVKPKKKKSRRLKISAKEMKERAKLEKLNESHRKYRVKLCSVSDVSIGKDEIEAATGVTYVAEDTIYNRPNWDSNRPSGELNIERFVGDLAEPLNWLMNCGFDEVLLGHMVEQSNIRREMRRAAQLSGNRKRRVNSAGDDEFVNFDEGKRRGRPSEDTKEKSKAKYLKLLSEPITALRLRRFLAAVTFCGVRRFKSKGSYFRTDGGIEDPRGCLVISARYED